MLCENCYTEKILDLQTIRSCCSGDIRSVGGAVDHDGEADAREVAGHATIGHRGTQEHRGLFGTHTKTWLFTLV